ncbi:MAG: phosphoglycerate kinase [Chloroflexi bacterium]|nr:phosphoglycerate kinase [Chloroflexota bacterium]
MTVRSVSELEVAGKQVLVRVDFNVPLTPGGDVADDTRLRASLPTIKFLLDRGSAVILMSHLGRPKGADKRLSLAPVAKRFAILLGRPVAFADDCVGPSAASAAAALKPGDVLLLENVRFHPEEEKNDQAFAGQLARLGDAYVNDAFGTAHRAHATTEALAHLLPSAAGFLLLREVETLTGILNNPAHPFTAIIGGSKISTKIAVVEHLLPRVDTLVLGGGMANTFLKAQGYAVGGSLVEDDQLDVARNILHTANERGVRVILPTDVVIADRFAADAQRRVVAAPAVPAGWSILDVGPQTVTAIRDVVRTSATVLWNGPLGVFEFPAFAQGTLELAQALADTPQVTSVVGGGESVAAVEQAGVADRITHVSTGGGASLELLEGRVLPGVAALERAEG